MKDRASFVVVVVVVVVVVFVVVVVVNVIVVVVVFVVAAQNWKGSLPQNFQILIFRNEKKTRTVFLSIIIALIITLSFSPSR